MSTNAPSDKTNPIPFNSTHQQQYLQQQQQQHQESTKNSKLYNIDYIVNNHTHHNNGDNSSKTIKSELSTMANGNCNVTTPTVTTFIEKTDYDGIKQEKTLGPGTKCDIQNVPEKSLCCTNSYVGDYKYNDLSTGVKHARTPINNVPPTHSPQLPIPSPNYPVQTQLTTDNIIPGASTIITLTTATTTTSSDKTDVKNIPNTYVPTINNNYISAPHHTSQKDNNMQNTTTTTITTVNATINSEHLKASNNHVLINSENNQKNYLYCFKSTTNNSNINNSNILTNSNKENSQFTVLNVPSLNFQSPPIMKKPKLSKIDLDIVKRKKRRQTRQHIVKVNNSKLIADKINANTQKYSYDFGVKVYGYSDSSSSNSYSSSECESDNEIDLWIKSGPPCKLDVKPEKIEFLNSFDLTTHDKRNCKTFINFIRFTNDLFYFLVLAVELQKLERRKWQPSWQVLDESAKDDILDLPVPSQSPSVLNSCHDSQYKNNFLKILGLKYVPPHIRDGKSIRILKIGSNIRFNFINFLSL